MVQDLQDIALKVIFFRLPAADSTGYFWLPQQQNAKADFFLISKIIDSDDYSV